MEKERSINELLQLLLDNFDDHHISCLCHLNKYLLICDKISYLEYKKIREYIKNNRPLNFRTLFNYSFYWRTYSKKPRIKWLKKHIKKTEKYEK